MPSPTPGKDLKPLALALLALLLSFLPYLCLAGIFLGILTLRKSYATDGALLKILGITAIIAGCLSTFQTITSLAALFQGSSPVTP